MASTLLIVVILCFKMIACDIKLWLTLCQSDRLFSSHPSFYCQDADSGDARVKTVQQVDTCNVLVCLVTYCLIAVQQQSANRSLLLLEMILMLVVKNDKFDETKIVSIKSLKSCLESWKTVQVDADSLWVYPYEQPLLHYIKLLD